MFLSNYFSQASNLGETLYCGNMLTEHKMKINVVTSVKKKVTKITILDDCASITDDWNEWVWCLFPI